MSDNSENSVAPHLEELDCERSSNIPFVHGAVAQSKLQVAAQQSLAAVFCGAGQPLKPQWFPLPRVDSGEALVRVECCTVCGSDLHTITGKRNEKIPTILGHEICGTIVETGSTPLQDIDGLPLQPGDRLTWSTSVSCGHCDRCRAGLPQKCRTLAKFGHESTEGPWPLSGGLAEFIHLPTGTQAIRLPADLSANVACPANCATATVVAACRVAGSLSGKRVLIFGAGMLGLTAGAIARAQGASSIVVCDQNPNRLSLADRFGATSSIVWRESIDELRQRIQEQSGCTGFDVLLELSGSPAAVEASCNLCDIGAKIILVGTVMKSRTVQIDPELLVRRWVSIHGVHNYTPDDLRAALRFLMDHHSQFPFDALISRTFSLPQVNEAIEFLLENRPVRIAIVP